MKGGPNWAGFGADSPIIVNPKDQEFYKQPMFYALAHIAKFILRDSYIIDTELQNKSPVELLWGQLHSVGAIRPDGATTLVILNR
jgi:glucosylceramidase